MTELPLVSIYIPTHNRCDLLKRAVDSVFCQTYSNIELFIINDGSSDSTKQFLDALTHSTIKINIIHQDKSQGACVARNLAINIAKGKFITGLDDDDEFLPERISDLVMHYDTNYAFICTGFYWDYGQKRRLVNADEMTINLSTQFDYNYASNQVLVETERLKAIGGFDEAFVACQDYDTWSRLIEKFGAAKRVAGASYIIHRGDETPRLTESNNWLKGHDQFMEKHNIKMTKNNKINQQFRRMIAQQNKMTISQLFEQITAGLFKQKVRYFLSSNLTLFSSVRKYFLEVKK